MTRMLCASFALALALPSSALAQSKPNFSGTWSMDPMRSASQVQNDPIGPVTVVIIHTPTELSIATTRAQVTTTEVIKLDGSESRVSNGTATARWDGPALVVESVRDIQGASVTTRESRRLDAGGNEMSVDTVVEVQHGYTLKGAKNYGTGRDVYTRVRP
jgi:hypothetical protein